MDQNSAIAIFCCYARKDKDLLDELKTHLSPLQRQNMIHVWHDGDISAGTEWDQEIKKHLNNAEIILLLISSDFIASEYCYSTEMKHALERHKRREARVIPVILRPVGGWEEVPPGDTQLGQLQALPKDAKPVTSWANHDQVWKEVMEGIKGAVDELLMRGAVPSVRTRPSISRRAVLTFFGAIAALGVTGSSIALLAYPQKTQTPSLSTHLSPGKTLYTYRGHNSAVTAVAWSLNGKRIASSSADYTAQAWDALTGDHIVIYPSHFTYVWSVAWSPDSKRIASGGRGGRVQIWDATIGNSTYNGKIITCEGHTDSVNTVSWSPNGKYLVSGSDDKTVRIWDTLTGALIHTFSGHTGSVLSVSWSPDGGRIASASADETVRIWIPEGGKPISTYYATGIVNTVAWSPDGKYIAYGGHNAEVLVWEVVNQSAVLVYRGHYALIHTVAWSPNKKARLANWG